ncbi:NUDIX hydrolase [Guptibacillus hwajinpoensis]|uniref:NUDIX hydrolase n=1 Tax=Guptibacillus hwajinpoensis TaxID=208199 RepID=A0A0J6CNX1_9BACL|nr:NUDIX domain-containing protein [Alkalihalobacillus macyae]KMM37931.1 NUDIX hydrolase [Alkalihalobacillus macyae]
MEDEQIRIYDHNRKSIGVTTRKEVHSVGYWHEVFQCWFVRRENGIDYLYFQLRSDVKKDYPGLLDITAAGHLSADESVEDGVREIEEELGIKIEYKELIPLSIIQASIKRESMIDNEIANVFLYKNDKPFDAFNLQKEEVAGLVRADLNDVYDLWIGKREAVNVQGFKITNNGEKVEMNETVHKNHFVPHEDSYFRTVFKEIKQQLSL